LGRYEIRELVRSLYVPTEEDMDRIMTQYDENKDGNISFDEFVKVFTRVEAVATEQFSSTKSNLGQQTKQMKIDPLVMKSLRAEFDKIDSNNSGGINRKEARKLAQHQYKPPQDLVDKLWSMMDKNKDEKVSLNEFSAQLEKVEGYLPALLKEAAKLGADEKKADTPATTSATAGATPSTAAAAPAAPAQLLLQCPGCSGQMLIPGDMASGTVIACPHCAIHVATP